MTNENYIDYNSLLGVLRLRAERERHETWEAIQRAEQVNREVEETLRAAPLRNLDRHGDVVQPEVVQKRRNWGAIDPNGKWKTSIRYGDDLCVTHDREDYRSTLSRDELTQWENRSSPLGRPGAGQESAPARNDNRFNTSGDDRAGWTGRNKERKSQSKG